MVVFLISQICERSLAAGQGIQEIPIMPGFVRAEMLTSGFLIRPYEQGGSMVMVIDDLSFKVHILSLILSFWFRRNITWVCLMCSAIICLLSNDDNIVW